MELTLKSFGIAHQVKLIRSSYRNNGATALFARTLEGEPFAVFSVNLPESVLLRNDHFYFKIWSENQGLLEQLEAAGVVARLPFKVTTGYVEAIPVKLLVEVAEL